MCQITCYTQLNVLALVDQDHRALISLVEIKSKNPSKDMLNKYETAKVRKKVKEEWYDGPAN